MTTHMSSDVDSVHSFKPHMKIEMEEDQLQLAPREVRIYSIHYLKVTSNYLINPFLPDFPFWHQKGTLGKIGLK